MIAQKYSIKDCLDTKDMYYDLDITFSKAEIIKILYLRSLEFCEKLNLPTSLAKEYLVDFSVKNPTSVKFYKSLDNLLKETSDNEGKAAVMKFGKFLTYTEQFTETSIKSYVEIFNSFLNNYKYYTVPVNHPDGWVEVYENGYGFSSCMVYNRLSRHLHKDHYGEFHPIRTYCHPDNTIELAYLANKEWKPGMKWKPGAENLIVTARAIINTKSKKFYTVYGDTALKTLLEQRNFTYDDSYLLGQNLIKKQLNGYYIGPYIDGEYDKLNEYEDKWVISENGSHIANSSEGYISKLYICPTCGMELDSKDALTGPHDEHCENCIEYYFVYAYVDAYNKKYIPVNSTYYTYYGNYYTKNSLEEHDLVLIDNEIYVMSETVSTSRGITPEDYVVELDIPFDGYDYAHEDDTIDVWDIGGYSLTVHKDMHLDKNILFASKKEYLAFKKIHGNENE
jgi:hypothetical protein